MATAEVLPPGRWTFYTSFHDRVIKKQKRALQLAWMANVENLMTCETPDWQAEEDRLYRLMLRAQAHDYLGVKALGAGEPTVKMRWHESVAMPRLLGASLTILTAAVPLLAWLTSL